MFCLCAWQGYASEMDNPAMVHLIPTPLQNKKEVLFGNMPEIYHFHKRWRSAICLSLVISVNCGLTWCWPPKLINILFSYYQFVFSLILHRTFINKMWFWCFQDISEGVGAVHRLPRASWKVFSREGKWIMRFFNEIFSTEVSCLQIVFTAFL